MYKYKSIEDTMTRIAKQELGVDIDIDSRKFIGQYVGMFTTEHQRHDYRQAIRQKQ